MGYALSWVTTAYIGGDGTHYESTEDKVNTFIGSADDATRCFHRLLEENARLPHEAGEGGPNKNHLNPDIKVWKLTYEDTRYGMFPEKRIFETALQAMAQGTFVPYDDLVLTYREELAEKREFERLKRKYEVVTE